MAASVLSVGRRSTTLLGRMQNLDELDQRVEEWTREHTAEEVMETLQAVDVAAGVVQNAQDIFEADAQLRHRGFWAEVEHPEFGKVYFDGIPVLLSRTPGQIRRLAPIPGDDNDYVLGEILGMPPEQIKDYTKGGVL